MLSLEEQCKVLLLLLIGHAFCLPAWNVIPPKVWERIHLRVLGAS